MSEALLADLLRALDLAVFERLPSRAFVLITPAPLWLKSMVADTDITEPLALANTFPFVENFLGEAELLWWEREDGVVASTPFAASVRGHDCLVRASAVTVGEHKLLVLERLTGTADTRPILQTARELRLEQEQLAKRLSTLHQPSKTFARTTTALLETDLTTAQRAMVQEIARAAARVEQAIEGLPEPPGHTATSGRSPG